jgi:hypothetical protein
MRGKPDLASSACENVDFPDPASPVTMMRRPESAGASFIDTTPPHVGPRELQGRLARGTTLGTKPAHYVQLQRLRSLSTYEDRAAVALSGNLGVKGSQVQILSARLTRLARYPRSRASFAAADHRQVSTHVLDFAPVLPHQTENAVPAPTKAAVSGCR